MLEQIGTMLMMTRMRDIQTDLMQSRCPNQQRFCERIIKLPIGSHLVQESEGRVLDSFGLGEIDMVACLHCPHGPLTCILTSETTDEIIK